MSEDDSGIKRRFSAKIALRLYVRRNPTQRAAVARFMKQVRRASRVLNQTEINWTLPILLPGAPDSRGPFGDRLDNMCVEFSRSCGLSTSLIRASPVGPDEIWVYTKLF
jgi:hypothetical protein